MEPVCCNVRQGAVVKNDYRVGILGKSPHGQHAVVWMDHDIAGIRRVREY